VPASRVALLIALLPGMLVAQATVERTPNLSGGWSGVSGQAYFHFLHRFQHSSGPAHKVTNSPTFLLGYTPARWLLLGFNYATASTVIANYPNEWEPFARVSLFPRDDASLQLGVQASYNNAARSVDGAIDLTRRFGLVRALATFRGFTHAYDRESAFAAGGGALVVLGPVTLSGDVVRLLDGSQETAWGAGVQTRIPHTPHTVSLHATNTATGTLQGSSRGDGGVRYGFEFTVPITLARYFGRAAPATAATTVSSSVADTVTIDIRGLAYVTDNIEVKPGTLVRWVNHDPLEHTVTDGQKRFDSGAIRANGGVYQRVFDAPGEYDYTCTPHPFMKGRVVVKGGGA